jgi:diketogulonate reductase-like aldo/keto reductase
MRHNVFVATKASARHFRRARILVGRKSMRRLNTDYIDLYQLHWPNYTVPIEETMAAMEELVQKEMVRYISVSNFSVAEMKQAQRSFASTRIVSNQVRFSPVEHTVEDGLLPFCEANQITVIAFSPLGASGWRLTPERFKLLSERIVCKRRGPVERFVR